MNISIDDKLSRELLSDILSRLNVEFLSRCKCVSKKWCILIESPNFVKQHFEQEGNRERLLIRLRENNERVMQNVNAEPCLNYEEVVHNVNAGPHEDWDKQPFEIISEEEYLHLEALEVQPEYKCALYVDEAFSEYEVPSHLQMPAGVTHLIGPLNGVFFAVTQVDSTLGPMALFNPALRQFKPLPLVPQFPVLHNYFDSELGFGLDPVTGDHKLVMLLYFIDGKTKAMHCAAYVCNSDSDDSWRWLEDLDPIISRLRVHKAFGVTFLNGVYYWLLEFDETCTQILAFDMATEKFRKLSVLGPAAAESMWEYLVLCRDSLALLEYDEKGEMN